jgi:hypothetical protein
MKAFSTSTVYHLLLWIQAASLSISALASQSDCATEIWSSGNNDVHSVHSAEVFDSGLRIDKSENKIVSASGEGLLGLEPGWLRQSREANMERALSHYARRGWSPKFIESLRDVGPKVAPYSRWANAEDSKDNPVGGVSLAASESICIRRDKDGAVRCSGAWSDFVALLTDPKTWDHLQPVLPLPLEILYPLASVPRIPHREYSFHGYSFSFSRVYEIRHFFLGAHPLREQAREELIFAIVEWMFRDFSNDGDDLFRWSPPGLNLPCVFSYGDRKSIALYSPLSLKPSHDWSKGSLDGWFALSGTPLEIIDSIFHWPRGVGDLGIQSRDNLRRLKALRIKYFPPEEVFEHPAGFVLGSDIFEVTVCVLTQSGFIPPQTTR